MSNQTKADDLYPVFLFIHGSEYHLAKLIVSILEVPNANVVV